MCQIYYSNFDYKAQKLNILTINNSYFFRKSVIFFNSSVISQAEEFLQPENGVFNRKASLLVLIQ